MLLRVVVVSATAAIVGFVAYQMGRTAERPSTDVLSRIDTMLNAVEDDRARGLDLLKLHIGALEANKDSKETEPIHARALEAFDCADLKEQELIAYIGAVEGAPRWRQRERDALTRMTLAHTIQENELQARINMLLNDQLLDLVAEAREVFERAAKKR
ncbi:MAG: hypothetical protein O7E54_12150 [Planctomycetota bacterium]|nr:hypothetical protein [Planctomycetota bacterium]